HGAAAATAIVQAPPHLLPQRFDAIGRLPDQQRSEIAVDLRVDRGAVAADRIGVTHALGTCVVEQARGDELEVRHVPVCAVGQDYGQRDAIQGRLQPGDLVVHDCRDV